MQVLNSTLVVLSTAGVVVNDAFNYSSNATYYIYNTSITNLTMSFWDQVTDPKNYGVPFSIQNTRNVKLVATVNYLNTTNNTDSTVSYIYLYYIYLFYIVFYFIFISRGIFNFFAF